MFFSIIKQFYDANMPAVYGDVKGFYERNGLCYRDPESGLLDITISLDGSWSHRGFSAIVGVSFIMEVYTGRALDVEVTTKCISGKCPDRDKYRSICPDGRFHGSSSDMERHNALKTVQQES